ncbi:hypothetical protein OIU83_15365 [Flavobacterium sp. LS1R49]|uniref:Uncharacterized protein n=1 Tax=Flavobacterium shii TaxID=2987687 RepID=A0A9X2YVW1_9FLAO|nr:hypothetical protein [Flavobacterium shii]MCV9929043.1 hypothetical protein [Flavobacterium shii]
MSAAIPDPRILKFIKDENGNVLLMKLDNTLITSFNPAQNLLRIPEASNKFKIHSNATFGENPLILDYTQVNCEQCEPAIDAAGFNDFLFELAKKFFFSDGKGNGGSGAASGTCSLYGIVRPTFVYSKSFITKNSKFVRMSRVENDNAYFTFQYGGYLEDSLEPYFKPYFGGSDIIPDTENQLNTSSLLSLDDMFFRFFISTRHLEFDVYFIVNPDSNTFTFLNADPSFVVSLADYQPNATSDTLSVRSLIDGDGASINLYVRWKNVPELEAMPV